MDKLHRVNYIKTLQNLLHKLIFFLFYNRNRSHMHRRAGKILKDKSIRPAAFVSDNIQKLKQGYSVFSLLMIVILIKIFVNFIVNSYLSEHFFFRNRLKYFDYHSLICKYVGSQKDSWSRPLAKKAQDLIIILQVFVSEVLDLFIKILKLD
jgi:hypothetical protein